MNPEIVIESFLKVLKTHPSLFSETATAGLKTLETKIVAAENESNQTISKILSDWCSDYDKIKEAVKDTTRGKVIPKPSKPQRDELIEENQFPRRFSKLLECLEKRIQSNNPEN